MQKRYHSAKQGHLNAKKHQLQLIVSQCTPEHVGIILRNVECGYRAGTASWVFFHTKEKRFRDNSL